MKVRAERVSATRQRILAAAVRVQRTVGPRRTTISDIARQAGVERPTVLRHFGDRVSLFMACTVADPGPDASVWAREPDPEVRLPRALSEQYAWYRRNRVLLAYLLDMLETDNSLVAWRETMGQRRNVAYRVLADGWQVQDELRPNVMIAIRYAFDYWAWRSLAEAGLTDKEAAGLMADLVVGVASGRLWRDLTRKTAQRHDSRSHETRAHGSVGRRRS
jgi:AcrR family transcriptional regulator